MAATPNGALRADGDVVPIITGLVARGFDRTHDMPPCALAALRRSQQRDAGAQDRAHGQTGHEIQ